jgi:hypothetical protein
MADVPKAALDQAIHDVRNHLGTLAIDLHLIAHEPGQSEAMRRIVQRMSGALTAIRGFVECTEQLRNEIDASASVVVAPLVQVDLVGELEPQTQSV